ncbi:MAG: helix-turn-helix transcriptional regulator [Candidatus Heimdallarchaeota archaeon]|nr:helix-turn-helix transcriptional regulator [Candidatus Heimdallarchaeota archaeon]
MADDKEEKAEIFAVLSHPIRRLMLEYIAEEEEATYTMLTEKFKLKSGPLYHHLRRIKLFVYQREDKKYCLTEEGKKALTILEGTEEPKPHGIIEEEKPKVFRIGKFSLESLIGFFSKNPYHIYIEFFILVLVFGFLASAYDIIVLGNFVINYQTSLWLIYVIMIASWLFNAGLTEMLARFVYKKKRKTLQIFGVTWLVFVPAFLFILITWLIGLTSGVTIVIPTILLLIMHGLFQIWSFLIMITAIGSLKELSIEKSAIISLIVIYIQVFVIIFVMVG